MSTRSQRLPSLNGLKVFWAAARHGSFAKAADELHVTPSAVSLQVRQLEDELGLKLFDRTARGLALTPSGQRVLPDVSSAFERLQQSFAALRDTDRSSMLTVTAAPSFATKWLLPRLNRFLSANPDIEVSLKATVELADFERSDADIGIRYGRGHYPGLVTELLMREMVFPVCTPDLLAGKDPAASTADFLSTATLLHDDSTDQSEAFPGWKMWLRAGGIDGVDWRKGPHFDQSALAIEAAAAGLGIALAPAVLVEQDLANGRLVRLDGAELSESFSYYLVYPADRGAHESVKAFRDWLFNELEGKKALAQRVA